MTDQLNLASNPYRNRVLPYLIASLCLLCALFLGVFWYAQLREAQTQDEILKAEVEQKEAELVRLKAISEEVQRSLTPEQRALLIASHKLVALKSFSWSRLFADLETLLPGGVSASRLSVQNVYKTSEGKIQAELEFGVLSRNYQTVMNMIEAMNSSGIFRAELRSQDLQKGDSFTYSEYTMRLIYTPRYGYAPVDKTTIASANGIESK